MSETMRHEPDLEARSPWSAAVAAGAVELIPATGPIEGTITVPGSKSMTNRALLIAALADGESRLEGMLRSDDSYWCIESLKQLGVQVRLEGETAIIQGTGGRWPVRDADLYVGAAGTLARFLPGALAVSRGNWRLRGSKRMSERPIAPLLDVLSGLGAQVVYEAADGCFPFKMAADGLQGGEAAISGAQSSQFISGLLLSAPYAQQPLTVKIDGEVVQSDYVAMTLRMMESFGIASDVADGGKTIRTIAVPNGVYRARPYRLEPDVSTCGYFWALAALTGGRIRIEGVRADTLQPDIELLDVLERMGCEVERGTDYVEVRGSGRPLRGGYTLSMKRWSDQTLTVAALAVFADAPITMIDAAHIRHHECDRIAAICAELSKLGIAVDEHPDGLTVTPGMPQPALLDSHDDHRMAMALALLGTRAAGIRIADPGCVSKTCPDYFARLASLGVGVGVVSERLENQTVGGD